VVRAALSVGIVLGLVKGDDPGWRGGIGNLSAPWIVLPLLAGATAPSRARGALTGGLTALVALSGFYAALTVLLGRALAADPLRAFAVEVRANRVYFVFALLTAPLAGWLGASLRGNTARLLQVAGGIAALEIVAVWAAEGRRLLPAPLYFSWAVDDWRPYAIECAIGLAIVVIATLRATSRRAA
jgi:hypothetical protein